MTDEEIRKQTSDCIKWGTLNDGTVNSNTLNTMVRWIRKNFQPTHQAEAKPVDGKLPQILTNVFIAGWNAHKASLDTRNAKGLRRIEEDSIADAEIAIDAHLQAAVREARIDEARTWATLIKRDRQRILDRVEEEVIGLTEEYERQALAQIREEEC